MNPFINSEQLKKAYETGEKSLNEIREECGLLKIEDPLMDEKVISEQCYKELCRDGII